MRGFGRPASLRRCLGFCYSVQTGINCQSLAGDFVEQSDNITRSLLLVQYLTVTPWDYIELDNIE